MLRQRSKWKTINNNNLQPQATVASSAAHLLHIPEIPPVHPSPSAAPLSFLCISSFISHRPCMRRCSDEARGGHWARVRRSKQTHLQMSNKYTNNNKRPWKSSTPALSADWGEGKRSSVHQGTKFTMSWQLVKKRFSSSRFVLFPPSTCQYWTRNDPQKKTFRVSE